MYATITTYTIQREYKLELLTRSSLFQTLRFDCDRFLSFRLTAEGRELTEKSSYVHQRLFSRRLIGIFEQQWKLSCYEELLNATAAEDVAYIRANEINDALQAYPFRRVEKILEYLRKEEPPQFIIKGSAVAPTDLVEGVKATYETFKLSPEILEFDFLWIQPIKDSVTPRYSISIIDIRLAEIPSLTHRMELIYLLLSLQRLIEVNGLSDRYFVSEEGYIWPGTHENLQLSSYIKNFQTTENPIGYAFDSMLVKVPKETYIRQVVELLNKRLPSVLERGFSDAKWHLQGKCLECDYYPICSTTAQEEDNLSRIPFLRKSQADIFCSHGLLTVKQLFERAERADSQWQKIIHSNYQLQVDEKRILTHLRSLMTNVPLPVAEAKSISMPTNVAYNVCITTNFDPASGLSLGFAFLVSSRDGIHEIAPKVYIVEQAEGMSLEHERNTYIKFATALTQSIEKINSEDLQCYVWDYHIFFHLQRVVQRYHKEPALTEKGNVLDALFPPDGELHHPKLFTYQPITVVNTELGALVGLPIEVSYSLYESANTLSATSEDKRFARDEEFTNLFSERIPVERIYELWYPDRYRILATQSNIIQKRRTKQDLLLKIHEAFIHQLNALQFIVNELQRTYAELLNTKKEGSLPIITKRPKQSMLQELKDFELLNLGAQQLENKKILAMSVDEREARFYSIRGLRLKKNGENETLLAKYKLNNPDCNTDELYVFDCSPNSTESRIKEGEYTIVLSNEDSRFDLGAPWYEQLGMDYDSGKYLLVSYKMRAEWITKANLSTFLQVELLQLGFHGEDPYVIIKPNQKNLFEFILLQEVISLDKPLVMDPIFIDFSSSKITNILNTIDSKSSGTTENQGIGLAYSLLHHPGQLKVKKRPIGVPTLYEQVSAYLKNPFNDDQKQFFCQTFKERVSMLWGPPGTGKTTVLAATIFGWIEYYKQKKMPIHICVGAVTYTAIDTLLDELVALNQARLEASIQIEENALHILRLRSLASEKPANEHVIDVAYPETIENHLKDKERSVVIVGSTWQQIHKLTIDSADGFDLVVLDEASQIPIVSAASYFLFLKEEGHVALAGDDYQLGPIKGYEIEDTRNGLFDCIYTFMKDTHSISPLLLRTNYRTNKEIAEWASKRFYQGKFDSFFPNRVLKLKNPLMGKPQRWPKGLPWTDEYLSILDPAKPVVVITYSHQGFTLSNSFEAQIVTALTLLYKQQLGVQNTEIELKQFWEDQLGIITPHRAQMSAIRNALFAHADFPRNPEPIVDTVERYQGRERDCIISSYVVSDKDFVQSEEGFILDQRRFNVTLTRARKKFIMLVSEAIIQHLPEESSLSENASHLQLFVEQYCNSSVRSLKLPYLERGEMSEMSCTIRTKKF
jgi:hypothetical protein